MTKFAGSASFQMATPNGHSYTSNTRVTLAAERGIIVDEQDMWLIEAYSWYVMPNGYVATALSRLLDPYRRQKIVKLHNAIMGSAINDCVIDHWDRNKLNNKRINLRIVDKSTSLLNRTWVDDALNMSLVSGRWRVQVQRDNVIYYAGSYETVEEATHARDELVRQFPNGNARR